MVGTADEDGERLIAQFPDAVRWIEADGDERWRIRLAAADGHLEAQKAVHQRGRQLYSLRIRIL